MLTIKPIEKFFKLESAGGILLMVSTLLALIFANTPFLDSLYKLFIEIPVEVRIADLNIGKPLLLWINDGLMAIFFLLVGLELKREAMEGELSDPKNIILPGIGAFGGMAVPALIYVLFNWDDPRVIDGWAVPAATDIAFALGVLSLLGRSVPVALKVFLTSLAIFDDVGAIIIIAIFYTSKISFVSLVIVLVCIPILWMLNRYRVGPRAPYIVIGVIMWVAMLKSGVHATLTGVLLAMFIPMRLDDEKSSSPVKEIEHGLHPWVTFFVLPIFAFANSGIDVRSLTTDQVLHSAPVGIAAGLFIGKQLGIFTLCWLFIKLKWAQLPTNVTWLGLYGTSVLCGIGFTMSLFISSLAFEQTSTEVIFDERLGILVGSLASGLLGYWLIRKDIQRREAKALANQ